VAHAPIQSLRNAGSKASCSARATEAPGGARGRRRALDHATERSKTMSNEQSFTPRLPIHDLRPSPSFDTPIHSTYRCVSLFAILLLFGEQSSIPCSQPPGPLLSRSERALPSHVDPGSGYQCELCCRGDSGAAVARRKGFALSALLVREAWPVRRFFKWAALWPRPQNGAVIATSSCFNTCINLYRASFES
jgi:hypothetical protein